MRPIAVVLVILGAAGLSGAADDCYAYYAPFAQIGDRAYVELTNCDYVQGFALGLCSDPEELVLAGTGIDGTDTASMKMGGEPDFVALSEYENGFTLGVVIDFFQESELVPGSWTLVWAQYEAGPSFFAVADITFCDTLGTPPYEVVVVNGGMSIPPEVFAGAICDGDCLPPEGCARLAGVDLGGGWLDLRLSCEQDVEAFSVNLCSGAPGIRAAGYTIEDTATAEALGEVEPAFVSFTTYGSAGQDGCRVEMLLSEDPTFRGIPRGTNRPILRVHFEPLPEAEIPDELEITVCDELGSPPSPTTVSLRSGATCGLPEGLETEPIPLVLPRRFKRGDANADGTADISDAIVILRFLFSSYELDCLQAADANDDGSLDVADSITLLEFLFASGAALPPPGALVCGFDATADDLGCRRYDFCN